MKRYFRRITAITLLVALMLGLVGGFPIINTTAANVGAQGDTVVNLMEGMNPQFDELTIPGWSVMDGVSQSDEHLFGEGGSWSLKLTDKSSTASVWSISDKHPINAGQKYAVSARVYGGAGQVIVYFYDANGAELRDLTITMESPADDQWRIVSKSFTAAANVAQVAIKVSSTNAGTDAVWFDSVVLADNSTEGFTVELKNGDFSDDWGNAKMAPGWTNNWSANASFELVDGALAATKLKPTGQVSGGVDHGYGYYFGSEKVSILGGYAYTASIDIKLKTGNAFQMYLRFFNDTSATQIAQFSGFVKGDFSDEWVTVTIGGLAPKDATKAMIYITDPWYSDGVSYFDNASIKLCRDIASPSFEISDSNNSPLSYTINRQSSVKEFSNADPDYVRTGKKSVVCSDNSLLWSTYINVDPNENYVASIWTKREKGYTDDCGGAVAIMFYDKNGTEIKRVVKGQTPVYDKWTEVTASFVAPENAVVARMLFYKTKGSGRVFFDDAAITQTTNYGIPVNLLNNGAFEARTVTNNSPILNWNVAADYQTKNFALDYIGGDHGYAGRVFNTTYMQSWTDAIPVTPGETYSITLEGKGEGRLQGIIRYYTSDTDSRDKFMRDENNKDLGKLFTTTNLRANTWTRLAVSGSVAPEGAKFARIWIVALPDTFTNALNFNFDNLVFMTGEPELLIPGESGVLWNPSFEDINEKYGLPDYWNIFGNENRMSFVDAKENPDEVYDGRYALKVYVPKDLSGTFGTISEAFPIEPGVTYRLSFYAKEDFNEGTGFQVGIKYYDKNNKQLATFYVTTPATGEWNYSDITATAADNAVYAQVFLVSGGGKGTVYFDKLSFETVGGSSNLPQAYDGDWSVAYDEHPRLYFDQERLEDIQFFAGSKSVCAYGYAGTVTKKTLLRDADEYLKETVMTISHKEIKLEYPMYPVLEDPTCRIEFETSPKGFENTSYPYMTAVGLQLVKRVQTLSLAYAITGDAKYGERAKQYALDISDFAYWVGYYDTVVHQGGVEKSSQCTGYMVDCVITAYDMCYDLFTKAELAKMEKALMEKGMEAMYADCWDRMNRGRDMDHATGMILAACTIMRDDNVAQLKKYLDMGMSYINWRLNHFMYSGINEGHSYDSLAIDDIVVTMATMERVTGNTGPMDHPYMEELEKRVLGFFDPVNGMLPAYSDANYDSTYYPYSMAVFSQRGNELATYYLAVGGALATEFDKLVYFTQQTIDEIEAPDEREANVTYLGSHGFGALRTGWDIVDSMLVINTNNSQQEHNHYDQNSIQLAFSGVWMLSDTGYKDMSYSTMTTWQMKYTNSTIFVDGKPQIRKGQGKLEPVFNTHIYGYMIGSAPDAYGMEDKKAVLNQFDRHVIMVNHDSQPYYVIIDELDSNKERNFGWNFYTSGWDRLEIDGVHVPEGTSATGNRLTLSRFGCTLHSYFVGDPVTTKELNYDKYGPTLLVESKKTDNYQFMNVLSVQKGSGSQLSTQFEYLMKGQSSTEPENIVDGEISWSTNRSDTTKNTILSVSIGSPLVMFRAGLPGDWISFPFSVPATKEYGVTVEIGQTMQYTGTWKLYIDDQLIETYKPNGPQGIVTIDAGKMTFEAGNHIVKIVLAETPETAFGGTICSVGSITLDTGESMGEGTVKVTEQYNEGDLLGATITYGPVLKDVVLFNRGTNEIIGGGLATNGQQASVIGVNGKEIAEGYAITNGTSLKYGDVVLMTAEGPVSIAMDYTMAKFPVKNDDTEEPVAIHEDFDIENPIYYVSAKADAATVVSLNVGVHAPYTVMIGDQVIESSHSGEMLTFTLPAGASQITILGTHQHVFDQYATNILNIKEWAGCGHNNTYYVSCVCGKNGTETFNHGEVKGHSTKAVKAVEATDTTNGCIAHYKCTKCGKLFADKAGTQELTEDQVIILSAGAEKQRQMIITIVCVAAGVVLVAAAVVIVIIVVKKKKAAGEKPGAETTTAEQ